MLYNEKLGEMSFDNLFAAVGPEAVTASCSVAAGSGELKRGTVLGMNGAGKYVVFGSAENLTSPGVLCDDVDATKEAVVEIYLTGRFNKNALIVHSGYTLTAADILALRNGGIFVECAAK